MSGVFVFTTIARTPDPLLGSRFRGNDVRSSGWRLRLGIGRRSPDKRNGRCS